MKTTKEKIIEIKQWYDKRYKIVTKKSLLKKRLEIVSINFRLYNWIMIVYINSFFSFIHPKKFSYLVPYLHLEEPFTYKSKGCISQFKWLNLNIIKWVDWVHPDNKPYNNEYNIGLYLIPYCGIVIKGSFKKYRMSLILIGLNTTWNYVNKLHNRIKYRKEEIWIDKDIISPYEIDI